MRLIDADEMAVNESEAYMSAQMKIDSPVTLGINSVVHRKIQQLIADTPTIDAVEVVRCWKCKYHEDTDVTGFKHCCLHSKIVRYNDFCSYGKRKEGAD